MKSMRRLSVGLNVRIVFGIRCAVEDDGINLMPVDLVNLPINACYAASGELEAPLCVCSPPNR